MATAPTFRDNNLYQNARWVVYDNGEEELERDLVVYTPVEEDEYYTVVAGDRLDIITWQKYKNVHPDPAKLWWIIADANNIENPLDISEFVGKDLLIPNYYKFRLKL
jgi:hypothetical protein